MIDLHCHILPGLDDGARSLDDSLEMARLFVADGVGLVACTPHIMPGVYDNEGESILTAIAEFQGALDDAGIDLGLVAGADIHIAPGLAEKLRSGAAPTLAGGRYALIEPPHHVMPPRIETFFFELAAAGFTPILTHPERLTWITRGYDVITRLFDAGVWMQITAGALLGDFGRGPKYWSERMLDEGKCHILASDAHDAIRRRPRMRAAHDAAATRVGAQEAANLVYWRPRAIVENAPVRDAPPIGDKARRSFAPAVAGY